MLIPNNDNNCVKFLDHGAFSTIWDMGENVLKITQDNTTIDFYAYLQHSEILCGLPAVTPVSHNELSELSFDYRGMSGAVFPNTGDLYTEIKESCKYTPVFSFLSDPLLLKNFNGYLMPKYMDISKDIQTAIRKWRRYLVLNDVDPECSTNAELDVVIHLFKKMIPERYYHVNSLDAIVQYLKERENWVFDPAQDNFLLDSDGKIIFADIFRTGELGSIQLKGKDISQTNSQQTQKCFTTTNNQRIRL